MQRIIKHRQIVEDNWLLLAKDAARNNIPDTGDVILPLQLWCQHRQDLAERDGNLAIWLDSDEEPEAIDQPSLHQFPLIAIHFPSFTDGRGFSTARLLRERYGYCGELRAIGDVLRDQLFFMQRCGFDAYAVRVDKSPEDALLGLSDFSECYQAAVDQPLPLFRRR